MKLAVKGLTPLIVLGLGLGGCVDPNEIKEIKRDQKKILEKLDELAKAKPAAAPVPQAPARPDPEKVYAFDVGTSPAKGPADAWVTIVEVSDFQCPFCQRVGPTLAQIIEKYGNDVRVVFKNNPLSFHQRAMPAAMAGMCAHEQGKFWEMHDKLFENQKSLGDDELVQYAGQIGLKVDKFKTCVKEQRYKDDIMKDQRLAMTLGARGTPAFFINGRFLSGAQPFPAFDALVKEELEKAKKSGVGRSEYYAKIVVEKGEKRL
ncbi:MAG: thioredoxin domain-containing protein [Deltaproteobacteria bacterium]|nr:thioredoxin domain-containing protein [Deltaproteobacteria bacterium]